MPGSSNFPMPGGAIGPNVHMMKEAGILDRYSEVLAEFPVVVKAGGAWTTVTPGSQQYWQQAFNNVLLGRWKKMADGYGKAVLGYFGRPPLDPIPRSSRSRPNSSRYRPLPATRSKRRPTAWARRRRRSKNGACRSPKKRLPRRCGDRPGQEHGAQRGHPPSRGQTEDRPAAEEERGRPQAPAPAARSARRAGVDRTRDDHLHRVENSNQPDLHDHHRAAGGNAAAAPAPQPPAAQAVHGTPVFSPFQGKVELVEINVKVGDAVTEGQVVAAVEAMKAKHDVKAPCGGKVAHASTPRSAPTSRPVNSIMTLGGVKWRPSHLARAVRLCRARVAEPRDVRGRRCPHLPRDPQGLRAAPADPDRLRRYPRQPAQCHDVRFGRRHAAVPAAAIR